VAPELAGELRLLAGWLGLEEVSLARKGDLAGKLAKAVAALRPPRDRNSAGDPRAPRRRRRTVTQ
jgi:hypothetical protein